QIVAVVHGVGEQLVQDDHQPSPLILGKSMLTAKFGGEFDQARKLREIVTRAEPCGHRATIQDRAALPETARSRVGRRLALRIDERRCNTDGLPMLRLWAVSVWALFLLLAGTVPGWPEGPQIAQVER